MPRKARGRRVSHGAFRRRGGRQQMSGRLRRLRPGRLSGAIADTPEGRAINELAPHPVEYRTNDPRGQRGNWGP